MTSLCAIVMSVKVFIDGGIAEFEIVMVVGHSWLKAYNSENIIEFCIRWAWLYVSGICSDQGIAAIFDRQMFIHKIVTLDNKVTISSL